jgi:phosphoribosyl-ATP pyrophosphohydrolase/phosphoribosyl-AMP cyclohydrolase
MKPENLTSLAWYKGAGILPAIVQNARNGAVLMIGYMNREALAQTLTSGKVTFFSRSRKSLWVKGETSGNFLTPLSVTCDCDRDALLVQAVPAGPVCHGGTTTCFPQAVQADIERIGFLTTLESVIADRIEQSPDASYTAKLHAEGLRRIAQKVGEEGLELALAAAGGSKADVIAECADFLYHAILLLRERDLSLATVVSELERRHTERQRGGES